MFKPVDSFENLLVPKVKIKGPPNHATPIRTSDVEIPKIHTSEKVKIADLESVLHLKQGANLRPKINRETGTKLSRNQVINSHPGPLSIPSKKSISVSPTKQKILDARKMFGLKGMSAKVSKKYLDRIKAPGLQP